MLDSITRQVRYSAPSALALAVLAVLWPASVRIFELKEFVLPTPGAALATLPDSNYRWAHNLLVPLYAVAGGFVISAVLGVALAVVVVWNATLARTCSRRTRTRYGGSCALPTGAGRTSKRSRRRRSRP